MLGATFRLRSSSFRRIPNPTKDTWPEENLFPLILLDAFQKNLDSYRSIYASVLHESPEFIEISHQYRRIIEMANPSLMSIDIDVLDAVHEAIVYVFDQLLNYWSDSDILSVVGQHVTCVVNALHSPESQLKEMRKPSNVLGHQGPPQLPESRRRMIAFYF